jgi:hypothetical protein
VSLIKKLEVTPERIAANQANAQLSRGPVTPDGLERAREARVIHGFYSDNAKEALRILGEDPEEFGVLNSSLRQIWQPGDDFESRLVQRLARAIWRCQRGDRMQESMAVTRVKRMDARADHRARRQKVAYERKLAGLNSLLEACNRAEFTTTQVEIDTLASAYNGKPKGRAGQILVLLLRLAPGHAPRPELPAGDGLASRLNPVPPVPEGPKREEVRVRLQALLREEIQAVGERQAERGEELLETTSPYYRDVAMISEDRRTALMARMEEASLRQIERLTRLLIKVQEERAARRRGRIEWAR